MRPTITSKKRILLACTVLFLVMGVLCFRVGWIQIVKADKYSKMAVEQQTRDVPIEAKRGVIYDTNGNELAVSATCYSVWARPANIAKGNTDQNKRKLSKDQIIEENAKALAELLSKSEDEIKELITKEQALIKVDKYLDKETADKVRELGIYGIEIAEDVKRFYPMGAFLAHTLGSVTDDNTGLSGLELQYNQYLSGVEGRWIKNADIKGNSLAYGEEKYYQAEDGLGLVLTIDETIQHYVEKSIVTVQKNTGADRVMALMMDPKTGDVLAMAQTPEFDPNDSKTPLKKSEREKLEKLSDSKKVEYWNKMWRNFLISDVYEPGSTFKLLTTAMALEEGQTNVNEKFVCTGYTQVADWKLKCWRYYEPHGTQTLEEAVGNSCNPVFIKLAQRIGPERFYDYLETFGVTDKTGIDFPGEGSSILYSEENLGPVELATQAYGQGVAVTPIQLITAISSLGNEGKLMQPRLVKALVNSDGETVKEFESKVVRQTVSKKTADEMREIMEFVVAEGGAGTAKVPGYRVGGKTGTAQ
ncbi:MAG: stage V sporulation protein D, partial [Firmicutes bacterium]|nr:stage V sporulation protein D [Bacillota bacterium]